MECIAVDDVVRTWELLIVVRGRVVKNESVLYLARLI